MSSRTPGATRKPSRRLVFVSSGPQEDCCSDVPRRQLYRYEIQSWAQSRSREQLSQRATLLTSFNEIKDFKRSRSFSPTVYDYKQAPNPPPLFAGRLAPKYKTALSVHRQAQTHHYSLNLSLHHQLGAPNPSISSRPGPLSNQRKPLRGRLRPRGWAIKQELVPIIRAITRHPTLSLSLHHVNALSLPRSQLRK